MVEFCDYETLENSAICQIKKRNITSFHSRDTTCLLRLSFSWFLDFFGGGTFLKALQRTYISKLLPHSKSERFVEGVI